MTQPTTGTDAFNLQRFVDAQSGVYCRVLEELRAGCKTSHWMWFIFPQIQGLGRTATARHYAITSVAEARAYLAHPILGPRLRECTALVNQATGTSLHAILGSPDDLKFRSSMTLFARATQDNAEFRAALVKYCGSQDDAATVARI